MLVLLMNLKRAAVAGILGTNVVSKLFFYWSKKWKGKEKNIFLPTM